MINRHNRFIPNKREGFGKINTNPERWLKPRAVGYRQEINLWNLVLFKKSNNFFSQPLLVRKKFLQLRNYFGREFTFFFFQ